MHVEQVLADVPRDERCRCRESAKAAKKDEDAARGDETSIFRRLFGL